MNRSELTDLLHLIGQLWSSFPPPTADTVTAGLLVLGEVDQADAVAAVKRLALHPDHARFAPALGAVAAEATRRPELVPPYHRKWTDDPPALEETTTSRVDVRALLAEARNELRGAAS